MSLPRSRLGSRAQPFCALTAAATATSTSALSASAAAATCSPVAGFTTAKVLPDFAGTNAPSMRSLFERSFASASGSSTG
jgi:hypothetical protein